MASTVKKTRTTKSSGASETGTQKGKMAATTEAVGEKVSEAREVVADKLGDTTEQFKEQATVAGGRVRSQAMQAADQRKTSAITNIRDIENEIDKISQQLRSDGKDKPAEMLDTVKTRVDDVVGYVENHSVEEMIGEVTTFARKSPFTFVGAAFAVGIAASRLLKADTPTGSGGGQQSYGRRDVVVSRGNQLNSGGGSRADYWERPLDTDAMGRG